VPKHYKQKRAADRSAKKPDIAWQGVVMAFLERLAQARAQLAESSEDPWYSKVAAAVRDKDAISTAALLDALRQPATTGTARRLSTIMRQLDFVPIKSRRFMPGGRAGNTVTRGWARPLRGMNGDRLRLVACDDERIER
jgi:hypothetical protein